MHTTTCAPAHTHTHSHTHSHSHTTCAPAPTRPHTRRYVQWRVEHDGVFASYQQCNLLNTSHPDPANASAWGCAAAAGTAAAVQIPGNATDAALCAAPACAATLRARLGWEDRGADSGAWQPTPPPKPARRPSAACVRAFGALCGNTTRARGFTGCAECLASEDARGAPLRGPCTYREIANGMGMPGTNASLCPTPRPLPAACTHDVAAHCEGFLPPSTPSPRFGPANWSACHKCVGGYAKNATAHWNPRTSTAGPCGLEPRVAHRPDPPGRVLPEAVVFGMCRGAPPPSAPPPLSNATWPGKGWLPNSRLVRRLVRGSWFSTPAAGECVGEQRPGDGSGCAWRAVQMQRVVNYSCANARVGAAVIARNQPCFGRCSDGGDAFPRAPSDCWTRCFYNTLLGNTTFGDPGLRAGDVVVPFANAFKPEADGGCPDLPPLLPPPPRAHTP